MRALNPYELLIYMTKTPYLYTYIGSPKGLLMRQHTSKITFKHRTRSICVSPPVNVPTSTFSHGGSQGIDEHRGICSPTQSYCHRNLRVESLYNPHESYIPLKTYRTPSKTMRRPRRLVGLRTSAKFKSTHSSAACCNKHDVRG